MQPGDRERMATIDSGYAASAAKARAWGDGPGNRAMLDEVMSVLERAAGEQLNGTGMVLEVGCGGGTWLARLAAEGVAEDRLVGIDLLEERVAEARQRVPGAAVSVGNARALDFPDDTFALVLMFVMLSSLPAGEGELDALREAQRVLAPGGVLAIYDMRVPSPNKHVHRLTRQRLSAALGQGTTFQSLTVLPPLTRRLGAWAPRLYPLLARVPLLRTHWMVTYRSDQP